VRNLFPVHKSRCYAFCGTGLPPCAYRQGLSIAPERLFQRNVKQVEERTQETMARRQ